MCCWTRCSFWESLNPYNSRYGAIPDQSKMEQEQRSLMLTGDFFKKIIITKDAPAPYYNDNGILVMSVYDFLLNEGSLDN